MENTFGLIEEIQKQNQITTIGHKFLISAIQEKQKYRQELISNAKFQRSRVFVRKDLVERKIKSCRKA